VIVDRYRGCRIEVEAEFANGLWDARVRIFRAPTEPVHVETIICQQTTAAIAEEGSVIRARRWVDRHSGRSRPKSVSVAVAVAVLCGLIAFARAVAVLIRGDSLAWPLLTLLFGLVLLRAAAGVGRGDPRWAWLMVTLGVVAVLFTDRPATLLLAFTLLATSLVAAVRLHMRPPERRATTRIESLLAPWWGWARLMVGAAFSRPPFGVAAALGVAWMIGLAIAPFGGVPALALAAWLGVGLAGNVLLVLLVVRFVRWVRGKRHERHP